MSMASSWMAVHGRGVRTSWWTWSLRNSTTHCLCFTSRGFKPRCGTMYRDTGVRFVACGMRTTKLQMSLLMRRINPLTCY